MAELRANSYKRGYIKTQLTRFQNFIIHYSAENYLELQSRLEKITPTLHEYEQVQFQIELAEPDNEEHFDERDTFDSNYFRLVSEAKRLITESPLNAKQFVQSLSLLTSLNRSETVSFRKSLHLKM
jgi:hypothetical protein